RIAARSLRPGKRPVREICGFRRCPAGQRQRPALVSALSLREAPADGRLLPGRTLTKTVDRPGASPHSSATRKTAKGDREETMERRENLFGDLLVLDCASFIAGPAAATIMSDFGARVIKIEPPV